MSFIKLGLYESSPLIGAMFGVKANISKISDMGLAFVDVAGVRAAGKVLVDKKLSGDTVQLSKTQKKSKIRGCVCSDGTIYKYRKLDNGKAFQVIYGKAPDGRRRKILQVFDGLGTKDLKIVYYDEKGARTECDYCIRAGKHSRPGIEPPAKFSESWLLDYADPWAYA